MRHFVDRYRYVAAIAALPFLLTACEKLTPNGASETMTLLRAGSEKVCIAPDVQQTLRDLIIPKATELSDSTVPIENRIAAIKALSVGNDMTTLVSVDNAVSRAMCNTTIKIGSANGDRTSVFHMDYGISPSAEDPNSFVLAARADDARAFAVDLVHDEINDIAAKAYVEQQERENALREQQLLALVTAKWLQGAWIDANAGAEDCGNGKAVWFGAGHVVEGVMGRGRWALNRNQLHLVAGGQFDQTGTIDRADPISFHVSWNDESSFALRRCTRAETEAVPYVAESGVVE